MAVMGLRIGGGGNSALDSSIGDTLAKALFGDPEAAIRAARLKSDLEAQQYQNRQMEAATAYSQAQADREQWELNQRATNLPTFQDYYGGLVEAPQPAIVEGALPAPADLPDPIPVEAIPAGAIPLPLPNYTFNPRTAPGLDADPNAENWRAPAGALPTVDAAAEPVPVELPYVPYIETRPELRADEDTIQLPQPDMLPGEVIPVTPEQQAAYEREVAARRAQAGLIIGGGGTADQMAKGLGIGEGIVKSGSSDEATRAQANLLYAGKTAAETAGASSDLIRNLRKDFASAPAFQEWETINTGYENMLSAMDTLSKLPEGDMRRGPADMRMIYSYLKMLDPNTGVKEGEYASAREAGGQYNSLWNLYDTIVSGAVLDDGTRQAFLQEAFGMHEIATKKLQPLIDQYTGEAKEFEVEPNRIIRDMPRHERPQGEPLPSGITLEMVTETMKLNPTMSRADVIRRLIADTMPQRPAATGQ